MNGDVTRNHYERLTAGYDQNWAYSPEFLAWMTGCILGGYRSPMVTWSPTSAAAPACRHLSRPPPATGPQHMAGRARPA